MTFPLGQHHLSFTGINVYQVMFDDTAKLYPGDKSGVIR